MAVSFSFPDSKLPDSAFLPASRSFEDMIEAIPGLVGLWDSSDYAFGPVTTAAPKYGSTVLTASNASVNRSEQGGRSCFSFDANQAALLGNWAASGSPFSVIMSFFVRSPAGDFQNFFGPNGAPRLLYRASGETVQWAGANSLSGMTLDPPTVGWHTAEAYGDGTAAWIVIDGRLRTTTQPGNNNANLRFGSSPAAADKTSVCLGGMFVSNTNLYQTKEAEAIKSFLFG